MRAGDVIFIGSDAAIRPRTFQGAYNAAKAGLEAFARVLAMDFNTNAYRVGLRKLSQQNERACAEAIFSALSRVVRACASTASVTR